MHWLSTPLLLLAASALSAAFHVVLQGVVRPRSPLCAVADAGLPERSETICILGGGFGGLYTALRLAQLPWGSATKPEITLVDKRDKFTFLPLLYELACGGVQLSEVAAPFPDLLRGTGIKFVQGDVTSVDLEARTATVATFSASGSSRDDAAAAMALKELAFDKVVLALGAEPALAVVPGAEEHALPFYAVEDAYKLRTELRRLKASSQQEVRVVVVGASYGGVELACNLAATLGKDRARITIVDRSAPPLKNAASANRDAGRARLSAAGVEVMCPAALLEVSAAAVSVLPEGASEPVTLASDLTLWTAGSRPSAAVAALPLARDGRGRLLVDPRLCVPGTAGTVYAMGDLACVEGAEELPATAQVALQQSDFVAWNLWAAKRGRDPLNFRYVDLGQLLTLGPRDGALSALGDRIRLSGPAAGLARRLIYAVRMPTNEQRVRAAVGLATDVATAAAETLLGASRARQR